MAVHRTLTGITSNRVYGPIYPPIYNRRDQISHVKPEIYNARGERMDIFFIRDKHFAHSPYYNENPPTRFLWDRYNIGLDTHFYSHGAMLETMGNPSRRYGMLIEAETITPRDYLLFDRHPGLENNFNAIFTSSERLLNKLPNARFMPLSQVWIGTSLGGGVVDERAYNEKHKNISIIASNKSLCRMHCIRQEIARTCKSQGLADTYGAFDGGARFKNKIDTLADYRYQIVVENGTGAYAFTEKILDCFATKTVPIYYGATRIHEFFNPDGIITFTEKDDISAVLAQCDEMNYVGRLSAIEDNFRRVQQFRNLWDYVYERM